jgi:hypothetical protein
MQALRNKFFVTAITMTVMLQIINISIDPADPHPGSEDLTINDIESCVEFVLEIVLDKSDAVKESDEQDDQTSHSSASIVLFSSETVVYVNDQLSSTYSSLSFNYSTSFFSSITLQITSPPPKRS